MTRCPNTLPAVYDSRIGGNRLHRHPPMTASAFQVGQTYYGSLSCAHNSFPVTCVKRTEKTVWFEHATLPHAYKAARSKVHSWDDGSETANFHRWYIAADAVRDNGWDMQFA